MIQGEIVTSKGYTEFKPRRRGHEEDTKYIDCDGAKEQSLHELLKKNGASISKIRAQEILGEEMFLSDFVRKHSESLLLWEDHKEVGNVRY